MEESDFVQDRADHQGERPRAGQGLRFQDSRRKQVRNQLGHNDQDHQPSEPAQSSNSPGKAPSYLRRRRGNHHQVEKVF